MSVNITMLHYVYMYQLFYVSLCLSELVFLCFCVYLRLTMSNYVSSCFILLPQVSLCLCLTMINHVSFCLLVSLSLCLLRSSKTHLCSSLSRYVFLYPSIFILCFIMSPQISLRLSMSVFRTLYHNVTT